MDRERPQTLYTPPPRPGQAAVARESIALGPILLGVAAVALLSVLGWQFWPKAEPPAPPPAQASTAKVPTVSRPLPTIEIAAPRAVASTPVGDEDDPKVLHERIDTLTLELAEAQGEAIRLRTGLELAVAELNHNARQTQAQKQAIAILSESRSSFRTPSNRSANLPSSGGSSVTVIGLPNVIPIGDDLLVTGRLWNRGDQRERGKILVDLLPDGKVVDSKSTAYTLDPNEEPTFELHFRQPREGGAYTLTAQARWQSFG